MHGRAASVVPSRCAGRLHLRTCVRAPRAAVGGRGSPARHHPRASIARPACERGQSTKTKLTRRFALEPMTVPVFEHMKTQADAAGCKPTDAVLSMQSERTMSRALKRWLRRAKIDRPELFADDATRQALRFHDLRATGITWSRCAAIRASRSSDAPVTPITRRPSARSARPRCCARDSARSSLRCPSLRGIGPPFGPSAPNRVLSI
jgi:hypothetical protein